MTSYDLQIQQGEDYAITLNLQDVSGNAMNLNNCNVSGFLKAHYGDTGIQVSLNASIVDANNGIIGLSIPWSGTTGLPVNFSFYDVSLYNQNNNTTTKILQGKALIYPEITY